MCEISEIIIIIYQCQCERTCDKSVIVMKSLDLFVSFNSFPRFGNYYFLEQMKQLVYREDV